MATHDLDTRYCRFIDHVVNHAPSRPHTTTLTLWLRVENNGKFVRGKTKVRESIENVHLRPYAMRKLGGWEYELTVSYADDADLDEQVEELLREMWREAELHNCFIEGRRARGGDRAILVSERRCAHTCGGASPRPPERPGGAP